MAQIPVRMNTQGMAYPLLSQQSGRTTVDTSGDLTFVKGVNAESDTPVDRGIPGVIYAHNVMPTSYGWQAIGYDVQYLADAPAGEFRQIKLVQGATLSGDEPQASGLRTYVAKVSLGGYSTLYYITAGVWVQITNSPTFGLWENISTAYINGYTYICIPFNGIYILDIAAGVFISRDFAGLDELTAEGIFSSAGYTLVWSSRRILWSSSVDVEDFVPSDISGAGGGAVQEAEGAIVYCATSALGFFVFTDANVVSAVYTANASFPFEFSETPSTGGVFSPALVASSNISGYQYAYTTNGIQRISHTGASSVLTPISDFIGGSIFEDFDDVTASLVQTTLTEDMPRALNVIGNRYIVISYASNPGIIYSHAIVVDAIQNRMGKLKIQHTRAFEFRSLEAGTSLDSRGTIAFLGPEGETSTVKFDLCSDSTAGVMLLGKIQYIHNRFLQLQEIELENVCPEGNFSAVDLPSLDGKNFEPIIQGYENPEDVGSTLKRYFFSNVAKSHTLLFRGAFELLSILVWFNVHGRK